MQISVNYLNDSNGNVLAVQLPFSEWKNLMTRLKKQEQMLNLKSDLTMAFNEMSLVKQGKIEKKTLSSFLDEI